LRPCAVSASGAQGLMQLMPDTADQLAVTDPFDPAQNIEAGARYLKDLIDRYKGDLAQALAAYNAGPGATPQSGGIPAIPETRDYVDSILKKLNIKPVTPLPPP
ncbi:MAG TPA: lytic transglycosylase domain-containing protein, partial [Bryobacteraceae bacterium]|nr:lytic transglycosylase domain-containing protein [Bryobacteraceae bacterium]